MSTETLSAFAAFLSVMASSSRQCSPIGQGKISRLDRAEDLATRFREPLLQAAHNLQSRLYNILKQDFLGRFFTRRGAPVQQERDYAVHNTCYLFGQYLCWVEIIRRESQYIDPRSRENNRMIVEKLEHVRDSMAESTRHDDRPLRLFRGEQRAVGELMLVPVPTPVGDVPRWECLGYAAFVEASSEPRSSMVRARWRRGSRRSRRCPGVSAAAHRAAARAGRPDGRARPGVRTRAAPTSRERM